MEPTPSSNGIEKWMLMIKSKTFVEWVCHVLVLTSMNMLYNYKERDSRLKKQLQETTLPKPLLTKVVDLIEQVETEEFSISTM